MTQYTVILLRGEKFDDLADAPEYGKNTYVALVDAPSLKEAIILARREVFAADKKDFGWKAATLLELNTNDYILVMVFEGHIRPVMYGWQEV